VCDPKLSAGILIFTNSLKVVLDPVQYSNLAGNEDDMRMDKKIRGV